MLKFHTFYVSNRQFFNSCILLAPQPYRKLSLSKAVCYEMIYLRNRLDNKEKLIIQMKNSSVAFVLNECIAWLPGLACCVFVPTCLLITDEGLSRSVLLFVISFVLFFVGTYLVKLTYN